MNLLKWTSKVNSYMEMMNSCSAVIPCNYLVFNLVQTWNGSCLGEEWLLLFVWLFIM
jgi:hypothetical protein